MRGDEKGRGGGKGGIHAIIETIGLLNAECWILFARVVKPNDVIISST